MKLHEIHLNLNFFKTIYFKKNHVAHLNGFRSVTREAFFFVP